MPREEVTEPSQTCAVPTAASSRVWLFKLKSKWIKIQCDLKICFFCCINRIIGAR